MMSSSLKKLLFISFLIYITLVAVIFFTIKNLGYNYAFLSLQDNLMNVKAVRDFVTNEQKEEIFRLQKEHKLSKDYFQPQLLSSTFSAKMVNGYYNQIRSDAHLDPISVRFASNNPRNPTNLADDFELDLLKRFNEKSLEEFKEIRYKDGKKVLYYALPTRPIGDKCLKCHSTPEKAPKGLIEIYGDKNGFSENWGTIRALISTEYPLGSVDNFIYKSTFILSFISLLIFIIFMIFYIKFSNRIYRNNKELQKLNIKLEAEKNYTDKIFEVSSNIIIIVKNAQIVRANKSFFEFFKYNSLEEFTKEHKCMCDYFVTLDNKELAKDKKIDGKEWVEYIFNNIGQSHIVKMSVKGGEYFFNLTTSRLADDEIFVNMTDVTELKKQEEQLHKSEKLASMGEMIGNIAHQWRQPLSVISTGASGLLLQKEYGILDDELMKETCENIESNAQYLSKTIDDFRNFIKGDTKPVRFNLKKDIDSFLKLVESSIKTHNIKIVTDIEEDIKIMGYPNELIQCFINIFNNSKDVLKNKDEEERIFFIKEYSRKKDVVIEFKDNGGGIPGDILHKIFEPYFTTKHKSKGTGLGLHMSYKLIVEGMGGDIKVENENFTFNGKNYSGAKFILTIPLEGKSHQS